MPANNNPIATQTRVKKIKFDGSFSKNIKNYSDTIGAQGYLLQSTFLADGWVICLYQRTR